MKNEIFLSTEQYYEMSVDNLIEHAKKLQKEYKNTEKKLVKNMLKTHYKEIINIIEDKIINE